MTKQEVRTDTDEPGAGTWVDQAGDPDGSAHVRTQGTTAIGGLDAAGNLTVWRLDRGIGHVDLHGIGHTAFGELPVAELTPQVQMQWPYNINARITATRANQSGSVTQHDAKAIVYRRRQVWRFIKRKVRKT